MKLVKKKKTCDPTEQHTCDYCNQVKLDCTVLYSTAIQCWDAQKKGVVWKNAAAKQDMSATSVDAYVHIEWYEVFCCKDCQPHITSRNQMAHYLSCVGFTDEFLYSCPLHVIFGEYLKICKTEGI